MLKEDATSKCQKIYKGMVVIEEKYVKKTKIIGGKVDYVVDSKNKLTKTFLEYFEDNQLIFVEDKKAVYRVKSKKLCVSEEGDEE